MADKKVNYEKVIDYSCLGANLVLGIGISKIVGSVVEQVMPAEAKLATKIFYKASGYAISYCISNTLSRVLANGSTVLKAAIEVANKAKETESDIQEEETDGSGDVEA